jgi:transcriptional regulator with XRE-family HTH domain
MRLTDPELLRQLVEATGLTRRELAPHYGISHGHLSNVLAGRRTVNRAAAEQICQYHGVDVSRLFADDIDDDLAVIATA